MNRRPAFLSAVFVAAFLAVAAGLATALLTPLLGAAQVAWLAVPALCLAYLVHVLRACRARTGRVMTLSAWAAFAILAAWQVDSFALYLLLHAGAVWLIRCLFAYSSLLPALADLALSATAVLAFSWALARSGSVFLATWFFFLVQTLWTFIPPRLLRRDAQPIPPPAGDAFENARRRADAALRQLYSQ